jgi:hypothetical protein
MWVTTAPGLSEQRIDAIGPAAFNGWMSNLHLHQVTFIGTLALVLAVAPACRSKADDAASSAAARTSGSSARKAQAAGTAGAAGTSASTQARRDPCELLTKAEVEEVLETTVGNPTGRGNQCHFVSEERPLRGISLTVRWKGGEEAMKAAKMSERMMASMGDKEVRDAMKKAFGGTEDLKDLGDEASFQMVTLYVRKADAYLTFDARLCSRKQAIAAARKAVARL